MAKIDEDIKRVAQYFRGRREVCALYIFGSAAKGALRADSDIDVAVLVDEAKPGKKNFERLKREYYAASPDFSLRAVDIVVLNTAPVYLKYRILKTGTLLFEKDRKQRVAFTAKALTEYLDFKHIEDIFSAAIRRRLKEGTFGR